MRDVHHLRRPDLLLELDGSGNVLREYTMYPGVDAPLSMRVWSGSTPGSANYYVLEQPGHVTGLVSSSSQVANQYKYTPWGQPESTSETVAQPLRFMARELDATTGLYYVRARWYDPALARFNSEDPIGLEGGINAYLFVINSPTTTRDPSGLDPNWYVCWAVYYPRMKDVYWCWRQTGALPDYVEGASGYDAVEFPPIPPPSGNTPRSGCRGCADGSIGPADGLSRVPVASVFQQMCRRATQVAVVETTLDALIIAGGAGEALRGARATTAALYGARVVGVRMSGGEVAKVGLAQTARGWGNVLGAGAVGPGKGWWRMRTLDRATGLVIS